MIGVVEDYDLINANNHGVINTINSYEILTSFSEDRRSHQNDFEATVVDRKHALRNIRSHSHIILQAELHDTCATPDDALLSLANEISITQAFHKIQKRSVTHPLNESNTYNNARRNIIPINNQLAIRHGINNLSDGQYMGNSKIGHNNVLNTNFWVLQTLK